MKISIIENRELSKIELLELEIRISYFFLNNPLKELKYALETLGKTCINNDEMDQGDIGQAMYFLNDMDNVLKGAYLLFCMNRSERNNNINHNRYKRTMEKDNHKELTDNEILDLQYSIAHIFIEHPIEELKDIMWELYSGWIYESADAVTPDEIRNMLMFYKAWELFINDLYEYTQHLERAVLHRGNRYP